MKAPQINLDTVKDALKKLSFLKDHLALLVPVFIALVAVLLFIPNRMLSARLQSTISQQSVRTAGQIDSLIRDVNEASQAAAMETYIESYARDRDHIRDLILQTTMRELLSYDLFPDTNETSPLLFQSFRQAYLAGIQDMIQRLGAVDPPTFAEIEAALKASPTRTMPGGQSRFGGGGGAYGGPYGGGSGRGMDTGGGDMLTEMDRRIIDKLCEDRARGGRIYASPLDLDGYIFWNEWKFEEWYAAVRACWYWQMGYWILEDIVASIEQINSRGANILNSPVKRITNAGFTLSRPSSRMTGGRRRTVRRTGEREMPTYAVDRRTALAFPPITGRLSNDQVHVMHFSLSVIIDADQVMPFIQELCSAKTHTFRGWYGDLPEQTFKHNQITVLESVVTPIERQRSEHSVYRYGDGAVVELDLICEYLFHAEAYEEVMPGVVKEDVMPEF